MDRVYHKKDVFYNTDSVNNKIGMPRGNYIYEKIDFFLDRINKKIGWAVIRYIDYSNNNKVEKQYIPYTENANDLEELLKTSFAREKNIHYVDLNQVYFYEHDSTREKDYVDVVYMEYNGDKPTNNRIRIPKFYKDYIQNVLENYRKTDPRNKRFDGYTKEPTEKPSWLVLEEERLKRPILPMPEPTIKMRMICGVESLLATLKDYVVEKFGFDKCDFELEVTDGYVRPKR